MTPLQQERTERLLAHSTDERLSEEMERFLIARRRQYRRSLNGKRLLKPLTQAIDQILLIQEQLELIDTLLTRDQKKIRERKKKSRITEPNGLLRELLDNITIIKRNRLFYDDQDHDYRCLPFFQGRLQYNQMLSDISKAKQTVFLESYILNNDRMGKRFQRALIGRAKAGVKVVVIVDEMGSPNRKHLKKAYPHFIEEFRKHKIQFHQFNPLQHALEKPFARLAHLRHRDHRKLMVIDGRIGYLGGRNIGDEAGEWLDASLRLTGYPVKYLQLSFLESLRIAIRHEYHLLSLIDQELRDQRQQFLVGQEYLLSQQELQERISLNRGCHIVRGTPSFTRRTIRKEYMRLIGKAQRKIHIMMAYFIPGYHFIELLAQKAAEGVDVHLIVPESSDVPLVKIVSLSYYERCVDRGIKVSFYRPTMLHAKCMVVDDLYVAVGSANLDYISLASNFEINAFLANRRLAVQTEEEFQAALAKSEHATLELLRAMKKRHNIFKRMLGEMIMINLFKPPEEIYN